MAECGMMQEAKIERIVRKKNDFAKSTYERKELCIVITLTFKFDKNKLNQSGYTDDELLLPMRQHAKRYGITERNNGVFSKDGVDALCDLTMFVPYFVKTFPGYFALLKEWTLDIDGEKEDCIKEMTEWNAAHGIRL